MKENTILIISYIVKTEKERLYSMRKSRWSVCTITTTDENLIFRADEIRKNGITHEQIYVKGLEVYENENK